MDRVEEVNAQPEAAADHERRLREMERWYDELLLSDDCEQQLLADYELQREYLQSLRGDVVDIGGGVGCPARFLHPSVHYTVAEPLDFWNSPGWREFARTFRGVGPEPRFVKARGEQLPFADESFDVALAYWSLNHAEDAARCMSEIARVLRPGGSARIVLEDMEPRWIDLARDFRERLLARLTEFHVRPCFICSSPTRFGARSVASGRFSMTTSAYGRRTCAAPAKASSWLSGNGQVDG